MPDRGIESGGIPYVFPIFDTEEWAKKIRSQSQTIYSEVPWTPLFSLSFPSFKTSPPGQPGGDVLAEKRNLVCALLQSGHDPIASP